jgi:hypothetical protein
MKHPLSTTLTILAVGFLVWIAFFGPGLHWTGAVPKTFTVRVTHVESGTPVQGATVIFFRTRKEAETFAALKGAERFDWLDALTVSQMSGLTSDDGLVSLRGQFGAGGQSSLLWNRGAWRAAGILMIQGKDKSWTTHKLEDLHETEKRSLRQELPLIEVTLN